MDISVYVDDLRHQLLVAADPGGEDARALADRLTAALEPSVRLVLLDVLSTASEEITRDLAPGAVEVRLRGGEPSFVVTPPPVEEAVTSTPTRVVDTAADSEEGGTARLNLRLPEGLKVRIEEAARVEGLSLNAWLLRSAASSLGEGPRPSRSRTTGGEHYSGWVR